MTIWTNWLNQYVKNWMELEDAVQVETLNSVTAPELMGFISEDPEQQAFYRPWIVSKKRVIGDKYIIEWHCDAIRRGIMLMDGILVENDPGVSRHNWYIGYTTAGNGTPAAIGPVDHSKLSRATATAILREVIM